jgi:PPOX class probable F420-dependent enzyme
LEPQAITPSQLERLELARVGRLATASLDGRPHCVPVCFATLPNLVVIALDEKPKRVEIRRLRRVRNILENPQVTLTVDHYEEEWNKLWFLMIEARATVDELGPSHLEALRAKYPQYGSMNLKQGLFLEPHRVVQWSPGSA